jgi:erythromycin esterase
MKYFILLVFPLQLFAQQSSSQTVQPEAQLLAPNKSVERDLKANDSHSYTIGLKSGEYLNAVVNQKGIDVSVRILAPDNSKLAEIDSPNGDKGEEPIRFEAKMSGTYRIEISSPKKDVPTGRYEISVKEILSQEANIRRLSEIKRKQEAVIKWTKDNSIQLKTVEAGNGFADLQPLKKILKDVHFVGLGEQTHGTSEFFKFKNRMLQFLVTEMGFRVFTIEASYSACKKVNDYVMGKTDDGAEALNSVGYWMWNTEEVKEMIDWIRAYNKNLPAKSKVKFVGFDFQNNIAGQARLTEYLNRTAPKQAEKYTALLKADLGQLFEDIVDTSKQKQGTAALENLRRQANDLFVFLDLNSPGLEAKSNADEHAEMREFARIIVQNIDAYYTNGRTATSTLRDLFMADNFRRIVSSEPAGTKFILWTHNGHLATAEMYGVLPPLGLHLRRFYGQDYYALGFSFNNGAFQARLALPNIIQRSVTAVTPLTKFTFGDAPAGSVEWYLAQTNQKLFIVDFRSALKNPDVKEWLNEQRPMRLIGTFFEINGENARMAPTIVGKQYDGLFFINTTTRARPNKSVINVVQ